MINSYLLGEAGVLPPARQTTSPVGCNYRLSLNKSIFDTIGVVRAGAAGEGASQGYPTNMLSPPVFNLAVTCMLHQKCTRMPFPD